MYYNCKLQGRIYKEKFVALVSAKTFFGHDPNSKSNKAKIDNKIVSKYSEETIYAVEENICKPYI